MDDPGLDAGRCGTAARGHRRRRSSAPARSGWPRDRARWPPSSWSLVRRHGWHSWGFGQRQLGRPTSGAAPGRSSALFVRASVCGAVCSGRRDRPRRRRLAIRTPRSRRRWLRAAASRRAQVRRRGRGGCRGSLLFAIGCGIALALAGAVFQSLTRNPLGQPRRHRPRRRVVHRRAVRDARHRQHVLLRDRPRLGRRRAGHRGRRLSAGLPTRCAGLPADHRRHRRRRHAQLVQHDLPDDAREHRGRDARLRLGSRLAVRPRVVELVPFAIALAVLLPLLVLVARPSVSSSSATTPPARTGSGPTASAWAPCCSASRSPPWSPPRPARSPSSRSSRRRSRTAWPARPARPWSSRRSWARCCSTTADFVAQRVGVATGLVTVTLGGLYLILASDPGVRDALMTTLECPGPRRSPYDKRVISSHLTAHVPAGSFTAIIGPNACGKSTLLRAMARLLKPRDGAVLLDGRDIADRNRQAARPRAGPASCPRRPSRPTASASPTSSPAAGSRTSACSTAGPPRTRPPSCAP